MGKPSIQHLNTDGTREVCSESHGNKNSRNVFKILANFEAACGVAICVRTYDVCWWNLSVSDEAIIPALWETYNANLPNTTFFASW